MNEDTAVASIIAAEEVITKLSAKRAAINDRVAEIDRQRGMCSYAAHVEDDPAAKKKLSDLSREALSLDHEAASIDAALDTAKRKLEQAQVAEQRAESRKSAREARHHFKRLGENGAKASEHLLAAAMLLEDSKRITDDLHALGYAHPNWQVFQVNLERAISSWIMTLPLRRGYEHRYLAPRERIDVANLFATWSATGIKLIEQQFGNAGEQQKEAAHVA